MMAASVAPTQCNSHAFDDQCGGFFTQKDLARRKYRPRLAQAVRLYVSETDAVV